MIHFKDSKSKSALSTRWAQMSKQEQIIEKKKMELQAKFEAQKQAADLAAQAKLTNPPKEESGPSNIFSNDGSFMSHFKELLEKQKQEKEQKKKQEKAQTSKGEVKKQPDIKDEPETEENTFNKDTCNKEDKRKDRGSRDKHRRWNDRSLNRTVSPPIQTTREFKKENKAIPSLMQIPIMPPDDRNISPDNPWNTEQRSQVTDDSGNEGNAMMSDNMGPMDCGTMMGSGGPMPPGGPMHLNGPMPRGMGPPGGPMPTFMGGPPNFPMPPFMGPNGPGGPGPMPPNMCGPNGPMPPFFGPPFPNPPMMGPNGPPNCMMGPNGPPNSMMGPNGPPNSMMRPNGPPNSMMGPNGPPNSMMGPNGPPNSMMRPNGPPNSMMGPIGPPNSMMGPNIPPNQMMGPNGPRNSMMGPNGPPNNSIMGPNCPPGPMMGPNGPPGPMMGPNGPPGCLMGPNNPMMGPNRLSESTVGPNGPPEPVMGPNGPPKSLLGPTNPLSKNMPFPPFGSNFGNGPPIPFMGQGPLPPLPIPSSKSDHLKIHNIPQPPLPLSNIPTPGAMEPATSTDKSQVLSADAFPPSVQRAANEVAVNGDHWENVLKAISTQDQTMWFLQNTNSTEYQMFRKLVEQIRDKEQNKVTVKPEDKYEPEFCLDDDDSNDNFKPTKEDMNYGNADSQSSWNAEQTSGMKREVSSQSDDEPESKRERRKRKKKSRWGESQVEMQPPVVVAPLPPLPPLPPPLPGAQLGNNEGIKLTNVNRRSQALMQYALTNYGTTNLSSEDWTKCEDNFKLNLLYQDMLKKRQEIERLAAAGKFKYEYDSDEDTKEGTWEHKLRAKEMFATEKWADELTKQAAGKHHIGDFLPPEELKKFMEKYSAVKSGKEPDLSDYKEFKLKEDNVGFKMLQKLGWSEGQGLGAEGTGIVAPINKSNQPVANLGLGANTSDNVSPEDDEFDAYRKRMMLAYRFRPNPLLLMKKILPWNQQLPSVGLGKRTTQSVGLCGHFIIQMFTKLQKKNQLNNPRRPYY